MSAGEISPELYGEVDLAKYKTALTTGRNGFVNYRGGFMSRGGFAAVGRCKQSVSGTGPPRPIPFQFSISQGYVLELGDQYMRFVVAGGYVLEPAVSIIGATQANPCVISVVGTPFANGDWVFISGALGMTQLNGKTYIVAGAGAGSFSLQDLNGNPVDSTAYGAYAGLGEVSRLYTIVTPYAAVDLPYLKFSQSADVMRLTCVNPLTETEYPPYTLTRFAGANWTLALTDFQPVSDAPESVSAVANSQAPSTGVNATFAYQVTSVSAEGVESIGSAIATCHGADIQTEAGANTITWSSRNAQYYNIYRASPSPDGDSGPISIPDGSIYALVGSAYGTQYIDNNAVADFSQTPPLARNPFNRGQILAVHIVSGGSGLSGVTWTITTGTGTNFIGYPAISGGSLGAFPIIDNGMNYAPGDSIAFNGAGFASGAIDFTLNPVAGTKVTLNGLVWTFVATLSAANQTLIQSSLTATVSLLAADLSASVDPALTGAGYAVDITKQNLLITANDPGPGGNTYTLATTVAGATPSGPTLTGGSGTALPGVPMATLIIGPETGTYPGVNTFFQERQFYANSLNNPDTVWASQIGRFNDMDVSVPSRATDAITASPWTEQVNGIQWLIPMPGGLIAMTGNRAWQIIGEGTYQLNVQPVTPSTTQAQPQAFNGCSATVPPIVIDYDVLYVEAIGNATVRDLSWNFWVNIYTGADLTILSNHLFLNFEITQWTWARNPYKLLWAVRDDGTMLSMTYLKEQEVYGWARHDTQGLIQGAASVTEPPVNAVYAVVQRFPPYAPNGVYIMERMDDRIWKTVEDTYAVDSGVSNPQTTPATWLKANASSGAGVTFTTGAGVFTIAAISQIIRMGGGIARVTGYTNPSQLTADWVLNPSSGPLAFPYAVSGSWTISMPVTTLSAPHIAGMNVVGLADGVPFVASADAAGSIPLPFAASQVCAGLSFTAQIQTPYLNGQGVTQGARKVIPAATVRLAASGQFQIGTNQPDGAAQNPPQIAPAWGPLADGLPLRATGNQKPPPTYTSPGGATVTQLWTGDLRVVGAGADWDSKGQVAIQQSLPLPLQVLAILPEILDGDLPERAYAPQQGQQGSPLNGGTHRGPGRHQLRI